MSAEHLATRIRHPALLPPGQAELRLDPDDRPLWMMARLSAVGLRLLDKIELAAEGHLLDQECQKLFGRLDLVTAYTRLARAMRQVAVLEAEMVGEREPAQGRIWSDAERLSSLLPEAESEEPDDEPSGLSDGGSGSDLRDRSDLKDRSDLRDPDDLDDYDRRSAGEAIASLTEQIRAQATALGIPVDGLYTPPGYDPDKDPAAARPYRPASDSDDGDGRPQSPKRSRGPPTG